MYANERWYLVQCKPRESFRALRHLENQGYTCFHPTHSVKRKRSNSIVLLLEPLFPHYLFVLLDSSVNWSSIRSTRGVAHLVLFNGIPASLDTALIDNLKREYAKLNGDVSQQLYQVGDRVLVTDGCFKAM